MGGLGLLLGPPWGLLGRSCRLCERSRAAFRNYVRDLGPLVGRSGACRAGVLGTLGGVLVGLGTLLGALGGTLGQSWGSLGQKHQSIARAKGKTARGCKMLRIAIWIGVRTTWFVLARGECLKDKKTK